MAILIGIVAIMPDLGNATILFLTVVIMIAVSGIGYRWFLRCWEPLSAFPAFGSGWHLVSGVERVAIRFQSLGMWPKRFGAFNPFEVCLAQAAVANSCYAYGNGGWFGLGLGNIEKRGICRRLLCIFVIEEFGFFWCQSDSGLALS